MQDCMYTTTSLCWILVFVQLRPVYKNKFKERKKFYFTFLNIGTTQPDNVVDGQSCMCVNVSSDFILSWQKYHSIAACKRMLPHLYLLQQLIYWTRLECHIEKSSEKGCQHANYRFCLIPVTSHISKAIGKMWKLQSLYRLYTIYL